MRVSIGHAYIFPMTSLIVPVVQLLLKALVLSSLNLDFAAGVGVANKMFCLIIQNCYVLDTLNIHSVRVIKGKITSLYSKRCHFIFIACS